MAEPFTLRDVTPLPLWRRFGPEFESVGMGTARRSDVGLVWSVSPGEWTILGQPADPGDDLVDLTHVRAAFRLTGEESLRVLEKVCALDFSDAMFPQGRAARTSVAGVATEIIRDDEDGIRSYLVLPSRSFGAYLYGVLADAAPQITGGGARERLP